jgi:hypothetical protein
MEPGNLLHGVMNKSLAGDNKSRAGDLSVSGAGVADRIYLARKSVFTRKTHALNNLIFLARSASNRLSVGRKLPRSHINRGGIKVHLDRHTFPLPNCCSGNRVYDAVQPVFTPLPVPLLFYGTVCDSFPWGGDLLYSRGPQHEQRVYRIQTSGTIGVVILLVIYKMQTEHNTIPGGDQYKTLTNSDCTVDS